MTTKIGTGPQDIPLNQHLGQMAFMDAPPAQFGYINASGVGNITIPATFTSINTTYYKWELPSAGWYRLSSSMRVRMWSVGTFIKARLYNNTTGAAIAGTDRMMFEAGGNSTIGFNVQILLEWIIRVEEPSTIYHQFFANASSSGTSIQSDGNGYNQCMWYKLS